MTSNQSPPPPQSQSQSQSPQHPNNSSCSQCAADAAVILHCIPNPGGGYRRLCTHCVLNNHRASFCPVCYEVYDSRGHPMPRPMSRSMCHRCPAVAHSSCAKTNASPSTPRYICPSCSDPNFDFCVSSKKPKLIDGTSLASELAVNEALAKQLVAAATIACVAMNKAAASARIKAEKKVEEAVLARKKAKDALDLVANIQDKRKEALKESSITSASVSIEKGGQKQNNRGSKNPIAGASNSPKTDAQNQFNGALKNPIAGASVLCEKGVQKHNNGGPKTLKAGASILPEKIV